MPKPPKRLVEEILEDIIAYRKIFFRITGTVDAALLLSQMWFWNKIAQKAGEKKFYKTREQWYTETGLSKYEQLQARERLRDLGYIRERKQKLDNNAEVVWYYVQTGVVHKAIRDEVIVGKTLGRDYPRRKPASVTNIDEKRKRTPG